MHRPNGFTLIELLVSLAVLGTVLAMAATALVEGLRMHADQEAVTTGQAKLRRVVEVFTQDLRSSVMGAIMDRPFTSGASSVSFALLDGGAGYPVLPHDSGNNNSFKTARNVKFVAPDTSVAELGIGPGDQALMVNANGQAILLDATSVSQTGGTWHLVHAGCGNTIDYTPNTLLFVVRSLGLQYDAGTGTVLQRAGSGATAALAFGVSRFRIDYVYVTPGGATVTNPTGFPARRLSGAGGESLSLARLRVVLGTSSPSFGGRAVERTYTGSVELSNNAQVNVDRVVPCA